MAYAFAGNNRFAQFNLFHKNTYLRYLPVGTLGWVKDENNQVRQCRVVGAVWKETKWCDIYVHDIYTWEVAGLGLYNGTQYQINDIGSVFTTETSATLNPRFVQNPRFDPKGGVKENILPDAIVDPIILLINKYGLTRDNFDFCMDLSIFHLYGYATCKDNTVERKPMDFELTLDESGVSVKVPILEGDYCGLSMYYAHKLRAEQTILERSKPAVTFTSVPTQVKQVIKKKVTIEIDEEKYDELKRLGQIITEL